MKKFGASAYLILLIAIIGTQRCNCVDPNLLQLTGSTNGLLLLYNFSSMTQSTAASSDNTGVINDLVQLNSTTVAGCTADMKILYWRISPTFSFLFSQSTSHTLAIDSLCPIGNQYMISAAQDDKAIVWNLATLSAMLTFTQHTNDVKIVVLLDNGNQVASGSLDQTIKIWYWSNGTVSRSISTGYSVSSLAQVNSDLIAAGYTNTIRVGVWNFVTGVSFGTITGLTNYVNVIVLYSPCTIAFGDASGYLYFANVPQLKVTITGRPHTSAMSDLTVSTDGTIYSVVNQGGSNNKRNRILTSSNVTAVSMINQSPNYGKNILSLSLAPTPNFTLPTNEKVVIGTGSGLLQFLDLNTGFITGSLDSTAGSTWVLTALDSNTVAAGSGTGNVGIVNTNNSTVLFVLSPGTGQAIGNMLAINSVTLITGDTSGIARVWDLTIRQSVLNYTGHSSSINGMILLTSGLVATVGNDGYLKVWYHTTGATSLSVSVGVALSSVEQVSSNAIAVGTGTYLIKIYTMDGVSTATLTGHVNSIRGIRLLTPDVLVSTDSSGYLITWYLPNSTILYNIKAHTGMINQFDVASDYSIVTLSTGDNFVEYYQFSTTTYEPKLLYTIPTSPQAVTFYNKLNTPNIISSQGVALTNINNSYPSPSSPLSLNRSSNYQVTGGFNYFIFSANIYWKFYKLNSATYQRASEVTISSDMNPTVLTKNLMIPGNFLDYGLYEIVFGANTTLVTSTVSVPAETSTYLNVIPTGITVMAMANGATSATIGTSQMFILDPVSYSVDSDGVASMSSLTFKFYCHRVLNTSTLVNYVQLNSSNIDLATSVNTNDCFNSSSSYYFNQSANNALVIKPGGFAYMSGMLNQFVISTEYYGVTFYQIVTITVNELIAELPVLSISCYVPAFCISFGTVKIFSASNNIIVQGSYTNTGSYIDSVSYNWTVYKNTGNLTYQVWSSLSTSEKSLLTGTTTDEATLPSNLFSASIAQYKVELSIKTLSSSVNSLNNKVFSTSMIMQTNQVPYNGTCSIDLSSGNALQTYFTITCQDWYDSDGIVSKYEFFASYANNQSTVNLGNNATGYFYTQFPSGDSSNSNRLYIFVQVFDNSGGITPFYITSPVIVILQAAALASSGQDVLSMSPSSPLVQSITSSDISVASSAIIAFSSSLNQAASNSTSNSSLQTTQVQEIAQVFVNSIASYDLTDLSSIKAASSALSVVSSDPSLITSNTATQIVDMCATMTENLVSSASAYGLTYVYQAASYIIDASANSIQSLNVQSKDSSTLRDAASKQMSLIKTISDITAAQLPVGGSQNVNKNNVNLTISRTSMTNAQTSVTTDGSTMTFADPCAVIGKPTGDCSDTVVTQQTFSRLYALNLNSQLNVGTSSSISTSFYTSGMQEYQVNSYSDGFYFWISKSSPVSVSFETVNTSNLTISSSNQLQYYLAKMTSANQSVTVEVKPSDTSSIGYLIALRYGKVPVISSAEQSFTLLKVYCPSNLVTESGKTFYKMFSNMSANTNSDTLVGYGFRQLTAQEFTSYCSSSPSTPISLTQAPILDSSYDFTSLMSSPVAKLIYGAGCYYLDESSMSYSSWGVEVLSDSNTTHTHCVSYHLTEFAGGFVVLPDTIDFDNVWANASFTQNLTIYLTVIIVSCLYLILLVWCRYMDWKDGRKRAVFFLEDNSPYELYFYELIVFTGTRKNAATDSRVSFILAGSDGETGTRRLKPKDCKHKVLQRGSVNSFLMSVDNSLGNLIYLRIWHDNSGRGSAASWFLKFIIVHDLQTREKAYFICNDWLAVDKSDGQVDRVLPVATNKQKTDLRYLMEKQTKEKLSDGHLWLSIVARPAESSFSRTDRLTCAFVLLCLSMLMNIMYYESAKSSSSNQLEIGPFSLSQTQIVIGVITNLIIFPPSFILLQIFRKSRRRTTRSMKIKRDIEKLVNERFKQPKLVQTSTIKKKPKKPFLLPWWFKIIGYLLSTSIIIVCLFFIIIKGISFGDNLSRQWLSSFVISVLTSICFTQPIQVILLSIFFVLLFRKSDDDKDIEIDPTDDGGPINKLEFPKNTAQTSKHAAGLELDAPNAILLQELKKQKQMENKAWKIMRSILLYAIFLTILFQVAFSKTSSHSYLYQNQLKNLMTQNITKVKTSIDAWDWISNQFTDPIIASEWYNEQATSLTGYIKDYSSLLVGTVLLRQSRVKKVDCSSRVTGRSVCYPDYGPSNYDKSNFGLAWTSLTSSASYTDVQKAFQYTSALSIDSQPYAGLYNNYLGGGYVFKINTKTSNRSSIQSNLASLQANDWIDQNTRALFIEFTVYNVNLDLFSYCLVLFEFLPTGSVVATFEFNPMNLYSDESIVIVAFDIIYMFLVVFLMLKEIQLIIKLKKAYLKHWWSYVEWSLIAFSWTVFVMYLYRMYEKWRLTSKISSSNDGQTVINFQTLQYWNSLMLMFLAACCFIGSVKLIKVFSFSRNITMLTEVFKRVFKELFAFFVIFLVLILAFTQLMYLMVYDRNEQFQSFATSLVTGFLMMLGKFNVDSFSQDAPIIGPMVYCLYAVTIIMVLLNMFITLLSDSFSQIRREYKESSGPNDESLLVMYFKTKVMPSFKAAFDSIRRKKDKYAPSDDSIEYSTQTASFEAKTSRLVNRIALNYSNVPK